jgi:hypothetical protein
MIVVIDIHCDNAAFEGNFRGHELNRILKKLGTQLISANFDERLFPLVDSNGNRCGTCAITQDSQTT